jgi:hypothetical protein
MQGLIVQWMVSSLLVEEILEREQHFFNLYKCVTGSN